ncbi:MGH1-like glycoside hydrolase domain-containing protein [Pelagicoccus albus]|uniref:mannosyl-oligosaccharide glucosidase n=1 Tax=Pelagicoccus albus TaxID=415222 RepID=A0A7X1B733_9BACT|nr:glucosidase [Pelagicoccus albus]MBC2606609.1 glucosidase [Pelagicoccus albus]
MSGLSSPHSTDPETQRLQEESSREKNWKRWGTYLSERQWGTVREDYSANGDAWNAFPFEQASQRAFRWGADGLLGLTDREGRLCFCPALWNEADPIIKERLFGLSSTEGNHGEDCKELYYYLDATPTHSYSKALYKYPHDIFPYHQLREENAKRDRLTPEYEILDTGVFDENRYTDVVVEYAKQGPNDLLIKITATNRGPESAPVHLLPKIWFRNTWAWGCKHEGCTLKPKISLEEEGLLKLEHQDLGVFYLAYAQDEQQVSPPLGFTENETDTETLYQKETYTKFTRDAFNSWIVDEDDQAVNKERGTMAMLQYRTELEPGESTTVRLRLYAQDEAPAKPPFQEFDQIIQDRIREADTFWANLIPSNSSPEEQAIQRQAYAGLIWSKQFYHYSVADWLQGDSAIAPPPPERLNGRNSSWTHLFNRDVISMPDKWEYPWYASWDLAFHMIPYAHFDQTFAKRQLILFLREWYMHPNGQIPAYEWALEDVNPPTHAWACWQVYKIGAAKGDADTSFLKRVFSKLLLNFTWWVNRKDLDGKNIFGGGFLGLDNIGLFDRSKPIPGGATLHQADGTAWMGFYSAIMLGIALELAKDDPTYEDIASKFFEHFMGIAEAINNRGGEGLWDPETGFYYDEIAFPDGHCELVKARSLVGLLPLIGNHIIEMAQLENLPDFRKRMNWYLEHRSDITATMACLHKCDTTSNLLLAIPSEDRLRSLLSYLFDESEFLSPYGIRSLSRYHEENPFSLQLGDEKYEIGYCPGDSDTYLFGGNSNWRGPIWFPLNYLIIESLKQYHEHFGDSFTIEYPTGSGELKTLDECAKDIEGRLAGIFKADESGQRPYDASHPVQSSDPHFKEHYQFFEFFHGDSGQGQGASHQTGWTALIATILKNLSSIPPAPDNKHD